MDIDDAVDVLSGISQKLDKILEQLKRIASTQEDIERRIEKKGYK